MHDVSLDNERRKLVLELLAPERPWESEAPTNCVRCIRLLDPSGHTLVRGGDHLTFFLLDLPTKDRQDLADALQHLGLPDDVVEQVNIDVAQLEP